MKNPSKNKLWVVVRVERGIPTNVKLFGNESSARDFEKHSNKSINPEEDEVGVFEVRQPRSSILQVSHAEMDG